MSANDQLSKAVIEAARPDGERKILSCASAFELALEFNVPPAAIGRICDDEKIKIRSCQLGCFR